MLILAFLVLVLVLAGCACSLWGRPSEGVGIPVIAVAAFAFVYLCQPAYMIWDGELGSFLTDAMVVKGLLVPAAAIFCLMWGWRRGERRGRRLFAGAPPQQAWDAGRLYRHGLVAASVGAALHMIWVFSSGGLFHAYGAVHGQGFLYEGFTAYIWSGSSWVLSGVAMMILSRTRGRLTPAQQVPIALFAGAYALNGVLLGSRQDVFAICAVLWVASSLARGSRPTIDRATPALAVACLGALLMIGYRSVLYLASDKPEAPTWVEAITADLGVGRASTGSRITGLEFVVHATALETVDKTRKYDFAYNWLPVYTVAWIPRNLWPGKPRLQLAGVPESPVGPGIGQADVQYVTGVRLVRGCATGIVAEMYMSFGYWSLLFFIWLGWCARRLLLRAESARTPLAMCTYTMLFSLSLNVFGQGFGTILVPLPYSMAPVVLYHWVDRHYRRRRFANQLARRQPSPVNVARPVS